MSAGLQCSCCISFKAGDTEAHQEKPVLEGAVTLTAKLLCQSHIFRSSPGQDKQALAFRAEYSGSQVWYGGWGFSVGVDLFPH